MKEILDTNTNNLDTNTNNMESLETSEEKVGESNYVDTKKLAEDAVAANAEMQIAVQADKINSEKGIAGAREAIQGEKKESEEDKKKRLVTETLDIMIKDLKVQAGFQENETSKDFKDRLKSEVEAMSGILNWIPKKMKGLENISKIEMAEIISSLKNLKNNVTGKENLEALQVKATFLSKAGKEEIAAIYQEIYPQGDYKKFSNEEYEKASGNITGGGGVVGNKWQA